METPRFPDITVELVGHDGNAFAIIGKAHEAMRLAGVDEDLIAEFTAEATAGDYDDLLATVCRWVEVE